MGPYEILTGDACCGRPFWLGSTLNRPLCHDVAMPRPGAVPGMRGTGKRRAISRYVAI